MGLVPSLPDAVIERIPLLVILVPPYSWLLPSRASRNPRFPGLARSGLTHSSAGVSKVERDSGVAEATANTWQQSARASDTLGSSR